MKVFIDAAIVVIVIGTYIFLAASQPVVNTIISTANASANWTNFGSSQAVMNSYPLYQWFIPGLVGIVLLVMNHRQTPGG